MDDFYIYNGKYSYANFYILLLIPLWILTIFVKFQRLHFPEASFFF